MGLKLSLSIMYLVILLVPIEGVRVYVYLRGIANGVSIVTVSILGSLFIREISGKELLPAADRRLLWCMAGIAGLLLYPSAIGMFPWDMYRIGYRPLLLLIILLAFSLLSWARGFRAVALCVVLAVAAFSWHTMESDNLWDYLTDPFITIFAWVWMIRRTFGGIFRRKVRGI